MKTRGNFFGKTNREEAEQGSTNAGTKTRCHYELLEVGRDASEAEIKKAYKKLVLKWHPDKNMDNKEQCTAHFKLIKQAYDVLNDPGEKAVYDRSLENNAGGSSGHPGKYKDDTGIDLGPYMHYTWMANEPGQRNKFYTLYRDLFRHLAEEEYAFVENPREHNYPDFGTFGSDYETVVAPFYTFWLNFATRRSFAWLDLWNVRTAEAEGDWPTVDFIERANQELREKGKRGRSEEVRKLVELVRKHDKRVDWHMEKSAKFKQNEQEMAQDKQEKAEDEQSDTGTDRWAADRRRMSSRIKGKSVEEKPVESAKKKKPMKNGKKKPVKSANAKKKDQKSAEKEKPVKSAKKPEAVPIRYEVDYIFGKRPDKAEKGKLEYRVMWKGYPPTEASWEPEANLRDCEESIAAFVGTDEKENEAELGKQDKGKKPAVRKMRGKENHGLRVRARTTRK